MTRCFLGFELTEDSRADLRACMEPLHRYLSREAEWPVRLVPPDNWHATLLFFPGLDADERAVVWQAVEDCVKRGVWRDLGFAWSGLALWPSLRRPGLLCLEAPPCTAAEDWPLTARLADPPFSKGMVHHLQRYVPHITLLRMRQGRGARRMRPADWARGWADAQPHLPVLDPARVRVDRVSLFLSTVTPAQPIYPRERTLSLAP